MKKGAISTTWQMSLEQTDQYQNSTNKNVMKFSVVLFLSYNIHHICVHNLCNTELVESLEEK